MKRLLSLAAAMTLLLGGCSTSAGTGAANKNPAPGPTTSSAGNTGAACTGGAKETDPGIVRITCAGPAEIRIQAGTVSKDLHGGMCQSAGDVWSANVGVIVDETGAHGAYAGPPPTNVAVNNTAAAGKATIQAELDGKHYFDLGNATITLSNQGKTAHLEGTSEALSDAPNAKITVDVTC